MDIEVIENISILLSLTALIIAIIALVYTIRSFLLKRGLNVRGSFSFASSIYCNDKYISHILLENQKDRAIAIYQIYLKISYNYYILVEDFEDKPLILEAFEVYRKDFDPIEMYTVNTNRIKLNNLLSDGKIKKQIMLATSEGKYKVKKHIKYWNPISLFFKNYYTANIRIHRLTVKGNSYGENTKYIVLFKTSNDKEEVVPIYPDDYRVIRKFRNFQLTKESLSSKEKLEEYLSDRIADSKNEYLDVTVIDYSNWQNEYKSDFYKKTIKGKKINWIEYYIIGPIFTNIEKRKMRNENKKRVENYMKKNKLYNSNDKRL